MQAVHNCEVTPIAVHSMQCMWKMGKGWKHRVPLVTNGIHDNKGKKNPKPSKRSRENEWNYSLKKICCLSFFSLVLITPCPVCSLHLSFWWETHSSSIALLKLRVFLLCLPKWICQLTQPIIWRWLCVSQPQLSELSAEQCSLLSSSAKPTLSPMMSCRVRERVQTSSSSFPEELLLHTPPVTQQIWSCSTLIPSAWSKPKPLQPLFLNND